MGILSNYEVIFNNFSEPPHNINNYHYQFDNKKKKKNHNRKLSLW